MKLILFSIFCAFLAFSSATDDQVTELPTAIALEGTQLMSTAGHPLIKRDAVPKPSSSESSEEKSIDAAVILTTAVTPIGVIEDTGVPIVESAKVKRDAVPKPVSSSSESSEEKSIDAAPVLTTVVVPLGVIENAGVPIVKSTKVKQDVTETQKETNVGASDYPVTEPPKDAVTPQGVEKDDGLPDLGLGSRKKRTDEGEFREPVTEPPKGAVTPEGVEKDDGLPEVGLGSRKKRNDEDDEFREPVTEPPKSAVTPQGVEKDDGLPDLGLGSRKRREVQIRARRYV